MKKSILLLFFFTCLLIAPITSFAHCDTKDGPVILAARKALSTGNVNLILIWVQPKDGEVIKEAFQKTLELRKLNPEVQKAIDNYFFETVVRIHRAGEGAPYTGLKDSAEVEIPITESDKAIESGSINEVMKLLNVMIQEGVSKKFNDALAKKNYDPNNVTAGREYVESYVTFIHYVEGIYNAAKPIEAGHHEHEEGNISAEHNASSSIESRKQAITVNKNNEHITHFLIIGGTLLIVLVQIILHGRKK